MTREDLKVIHDHLMALLKLCENPSQATMLSNQLVELSRHDRELQRADRRPSIPPRGRETIIEG